MNMLKVSKSKLSEVNWYYKFLNNILFKPLPKFLKTQKERLSPKEFLETYPNYHEIERKYRALRNNLFENHSDKTKVDTFIKNIEKYISTVEDYCAEA